MPFDSTQLEQELVKQKLVTEKALENLKESAKQHNASLLSILFEREAVADEKLGRLVADLYDVPFSKISEVNITEDLLRILPYSVASNQLVLPFKKEGNYLYLAMNQPDNYELISFLEKKTGMVVKPHYATKKELKSALKYYNRDVNQKFSKLLKGALDSGDNSLESLKDVSKILDTIILFAYQSSASDIHLEPHEEFFAVRYRVDGLLQLIAELPIKIYELLVTRVKVLSDLRTDEHRAPQDGRFKVTLEGNDITTRVSIVPTYYGEKIVLRLLSSINQDLNLEALGYSIHNLEVINQNISKTVGIILVTGPTGSGKTTTLYSILKLLNSPEVNLSTIEDPIEYKLEGVNQIQVNNTANLTFATGLRTLLRQDPDVIMVGEIRDEETAGIAVNAALTGHLVLATLHTNDAASTLMRLGEMGVESFLLAATAKMVVAQRLVRRVCDKCRLDYEVSFDQLEVLGRNAGVKMDFKALFLSILERNPDLKERAKENGFVFSKGKGCPHCGNSGYKGRAPIAEVMEVSNEVKNLILEGATADKLQEQSEKDGMLSMFVDGMTKVLQGVTTIEEVLRVMRT